MATILMSRMIILFVFMLTSCEKSIEFIEPEVSKKIICVNNVDWYKCIDQDGLECVFYQGSVNCNWEKYNNGNNK